MSENLKDLLSCHVCEKRYDDPRLLPCQHNFCLKCLESKPLVQRDGRCMICCPVCEHLQELPKESVTNLPKSLLLAQLCTAMESEEKKEENMCKTHDRLRDYFCKECETVMCPFCADADHGGPNHSKQLIVNCYDQHYQPIKERIERVESEITQVKSAKAKLDAKAVEIEANHSATAKAINLRADELIRSIDAQKGRLLGEAKQAMDRKQAMLQMQWDDGDAMLTRLESCEQTVKLLLDKVPRHLVLEGKRPIMKALDSASEVVNLECLEHSENPDMEYRKKTLEDNLLGEINVSFSSNAFEVTALPEVIKSKENTPFEVQCKGNETTRFRPLPSMVSYQLVGHDYHIESDKKRTAHSFTPKSHGRHQLRVKVGDYSIGPITEIMVHPVAQRSIFDNILAPVYIACAGDGGLVAVSETKQNRVRVFRPNADESSIACPSPLGIAFTPQNTLTIASRKLIKEFEVNGNLVRESNFQRSRFIWTYPNACDDPRNLSIHMQEVFITDYRNGKLLVSNLELADTNQILDGCRTPTGVAVNSDGDVFVTSSDNCHVIKYNKRADEKITFGSKGAHYGQLKNPTDIAIDKNDIIYIADCDNHRISVFNSDGQFLMCFGQEGSELGYLNRPSGVCVDEDGRIYVCDTGNNRVVLYN